jgi:hypothetical protein
MNESQSSFWTDNAWGRPVGALVSPGATFRSLRQRPTWLPAMLVLILVTVVIQAFTFTKVDMVEVVQKAVQERGTDMSQEDIEQAAGIQSKVAVGCGIIFSPAFYLIAALLFMVLLNLAGGEVSFVGSLSVVVHGLMPFLIAGILSAVVIAGRSSLTLEEVKAGTLLASNLAVLAPAGASAVVVALLASLDVFTVWCLGLLTVGFAEMAGVSRTKAGVVTVVLWLFAVAVKVSLMSLGG